MSRIWKIGLVVFAASGLLLAGCEKEGGSDKETKEQKEEKSRAEEPKEESGEEEKKAEKEESADYSQEDYVQAAAELSCIDSKLGDDKIEDRQKVDKNVLGKYGFDQETYEKADSALADKDAVKTKIDKQLEDCTKQKAMTFAGMEDSGDDGESEEQAEKAEESKPDPKPAYVGSLSGKKQKASGFDRVKLDVTISKDFSANGNFVGSREGKGFRVPLEGKVTRDNKLSLSGSKGKNEVTVEGNVKKGGMMTEVSGAIWDSKFSTTMKVK